MEPFFITIHHDDKAEKFRVFPSNLPQGINYLVNVRGTDIRFQTDTNGDILPVQIPDGVDVELLKDISTLLEDHHV